MKRYSMIDQASPPKSVSSCAFPPHPSTLVKDADKTAASWCAGRDKKEQRTCLKAMKSDVKSVCLAVVESDIRCSRACASNQTKTRTRMRREDSRWHLSDRGSRSTDSDGEMGAARTQDERGGALQRWPRVPSGPISGRASAQPEGK